MSILLEIGPGRFSLLEVRGLGGEDRQEGLDRIGIEFPTTLLSPLLPGLAVGIQTLRERIESLFGVETIDNLHRLREELAGQIRGPSHAWDSWSVLHDVRGREIGSPGSLDEVDE